MCRCGTGILCNSCEYRHITSTCSKGEVLSLSWSCLNEKHETNTAHTSRRALNSVRKSDLNRGTARWCRSWCICTLWCAQAILWLPVEAVLWVIYIERKTIERGLQFVLVTMFLVWNCVYLVLLLKACDFRVALLETNFSSSSVLTSNPEGSNHISLQRCEYKALATMLLSYGMVTSNEN